MLLLVLVVDGELVVRLEEERDEVVGGVATNEVGGEVYSVRAVGHACGADSVQLPTDLDVVVLHDLVCGDLLLCLVVLQSYS